MAYEEYTDEELMQMAGDQPDIGGYSDYSDEELMAMAGTRPPSGATRSWEDERPLSVNRLNEDLVKRGIAIEGTLSAPSDENIFQTLKKAPGRVLDIMGDVAGFGVDIAMQGAEHAYKNIFDPESQETIKGWGRELFAAPPVSAGESLEESFGYVPGRTVKTLGEAYGKLKETFPEGVKHAEALGNIAVGLPVLKGVSKGVDLAGMATEEAWNIAKDIPAKTGGLLWPKPSPEEALRQVLQSKGKTPAAIEKDLAKGADAISALDTTGIKKYNDFDEAIKKEIPKLAEKVDAELLTDPTIYKLDDLATVDKTRGGSPVKSNYVETALTQLSELYAKTDDLVAAANMDELLTKAAKTGLTKKEVNDIARQYGSEYRAFNPVTGEPPTSVSKQGYENVRSGLKEVARRGLSDTAKELDSTMSSLFNTQRLVEQNAVAAAKLRAKYAERGIIEKAGRFIVNTADLLTGGIIKGGIRALFPSNIGIKARNAVQIEEKLARNLKIINAEIKRVEELNRIGPTGPAEGPPATRGFRGNERLGTRAIAYDPFEDVTPRIRAPYEYPPQLPPGQGFTFPDQKLLRAPYETPPQITGQGFDLYGEPLGGPYHPEWLPVVSQATGEGFTSVPRSSTSGIGSIDTTRAALRPEIGRPPTKFGVSDIESPISERGVIPPGEVPPFATGALSELFIRAAKKSEIGNPTRSLSSIPDKEGYEKVFKPYGEQGRGFYYVPKDKGPGTIGMTFREAQELFRRKR